MAVRIVDARLQQNKNLKGEECSDKAIPNRLAVGLTLYHLATWLVWLLVTLEIQGSNQVGPKDFFSKELLYL